MKEAIRRGMVGARFSNAGGFRRSPGAHRPTPRCKFTEDAGDRELCELRAAIAVPVAPPNAAPRGGSRQPSTSSTCQAEGSVFFFPREAETSETSAPAKGKTGAPGRIRTCGLK